MATPPPPWTSVVEAVVQYTKKFGGANDTGKLKEAALLLDWTYGSKVRGRSLFVGGGRATWPVVEIVLHHRHRMILRGDNVKVEMDRALAATGKYTATGDTISGKNFRMDFLAYVRDALASNDLLVVTDPAKVIELDFPLVSMVEFPSDDDSSDES